MAKYWNTTKHEDTIEKRPLTSDDIEFLLNMQKELNTQDHLSQAHPRYWTIRDYKKIYGSDLNNPDGICIYDPDACETIYEGPNDRITDEIKESLYETLKDYVAFKEEVQRVLSDIDYVSDLCDFCEQLHLYTYEYEEYAFDSGIFLTHEAAINHLKSNEHHYTSKAHTYAHTAIRTEEKPLWNILSEIDWTLYKE